MVVKKVIVIGAGIGGLTAGALLARRGYQVLIFEQAYVAGGCASTFKRRGFTFDVGATQVAGLEEGGIHQKIFDQLEIELPQATPCDPACAVFLPGESQGINVWRNPAHWQAERQKQFPGSEPFWQLLAKLFQASWQFQGREPILPPGNLWDVGQLLGALRLDTLITVPFTFMTVAEALKLYGLWEDRRLKTFLDLQLKLYSQVGTEETALLYAATALGVSQQPQGLYHLQGSMQVLSDSLVAGLEKYGGKLLLQHTVEEILTEGENAVGVKIKNNQTGEIWTESAQEIIANVTVQNLVQMVAGDILNKPFSSLLPYPNTYKNRVAKLIQPSGAFVVYLGVDKRAIPHECPPHLQFLYDYDGEIGENNSLFVSVSKPGDGRAQIGKATIIASSFTNVDMWWKQEREDYDKLKQKYTKDAIAKLGKYFDLSPENIIHQEAATPRTFARFTARDKGIVGGIGQRISTFAPFAIGTRTPVKNLWLVGDSTHPGEGTAGVSYSALTVVRQIAQENNSN